MVDPMYQFSLSAFLQVFIKSLKRAMPNSSLPRRLDNIKSTLTFLVFSYGCTGEFGASYSLSKLSVRKITFLWEL